MRAHEIVEDWKLHVAEGNDISLKEYRSAFVKMIGVPNKIDEDLLEALVIDRDNEYNECDDLLDSESVFSTSDVVVRKEPKTKKRSNKEDAKEVYNSLVNSSMSRKDVVKNMAEKLNVSESSANVYYSMFKTGKW